MSSAKSLTDLLVPLKADASGFRSELQSAKQFAISSTASIGQSFDKLGDVYKRQAGNINSLKGQLLSFGKDATSSFGQLSGTVQALGAGLAMGGGIGLGLTAASQAAGALVSHFQDAAKAKEHFEVLSRTLGVTEDYAKGISSAFDEAGISVDRLASQNIARLAKESNLSETEVRGLTTRIKDLMVLDGLSAENAAAKAISEIGKAADKTSDSLKALQKVLHDAKFVSADSLAEASTSSITNKQIEAVQVEAKARAAYQEAQEKFRAAQRSLEASPGSTSRMADYNKTLAEMRSASANLDAKIKEADKLRAQAAEENKALGQYTGLKADTAKGKISEGVAAVDSQNAEKAKMEAVANASARYANSIQTALQQAILLGDEEEAITQRTLQRLDALERSKGQYEETDYEAQKTIIYAEEEQARTELARRSARERADFDAQMASARASLTATQVDDLQLQMEREVEATRRAVEDRVLAEEEGTRRIAEIRSLYSARIGKTMADEATKAQDEINRKLLDEKRIRSEALAVGAQAGAALVSGLGQALNSDDSKGVFRAFLGLAGVFASLAGGPIGTVAGPLLGAFAGMFADGGYIQGPGGPKSDDVLALVSSGEFVQQASAVDKFGVRFMEKLNEGVLDLSSLKKFATGGAIGPTASSPSSGIQGATGTTTNIYVGSYDPATTAQAIEKIIQPASYQRGMTNSDAALIQQTGRRINRPTGRR